MENQITNIDHHLTLFNYIHMINVDLKSINDSNGQHDNSKWNKLIKSISKLKIKTIIMKDHYNKIKRLHENKNNSFIGQKLMNHVHNLCELKTEAVCIAGHSKINSSAIIRNNDNEIIEGLLKINLGVTKFEETNNLSCIEKLTNFNNNFNLDKNYNIKNNRINYSTKEDKTEDLDTQLTVNRNKLSFIDNIKLKFVKIKESLMQNTESSKRQSDRLATKHQTSKAASRETESTDSDTDTNNKTTSTLNNLLRAKSTKRKSYNVKILTAEEKEAKKQARLDKQIKNRDKLHKQARPEFNQSEQAIAINLNMNSHPQNQLTDQSEQQVPPTRQQPSSSHQLPLPPQQPLVQQQQIQQQQIQQQQIQQQQTQQQQTQQQQTQQQQTQQQNLKQQNATTSKASQNQKLLFDNKLVLKNKKARKEVIFESDEDLTDSPSDTSSSNSDTDSDYEDTSDSSSNQMEQSNVDNESTSLNTRKLIKAKRLTLSEKLDTTSIFPSANKLKNIDIINDLAKKDKNIIMQYKNNFNIIYSGDGTISNIDELLNSEFIISDEKEKINLIKTKISNRQQLGDDDITVLKVNENTLQNILSEQTNLAVEADIYVRDPDLFSNEDFINLKEILLTYKRSKTMTATHMRELRDGNKISYEKQKNKLLWSSIDEIISTNEMVEEDVTIAKTLKTQLGTNKCLIDTELDELNKLLTKQKDIALLRYQSKIVSDAKNIKPISKENSQELTRIGNQLLNHEPVDMKDIRKITTWIERSKLDDEQTPYYAEMKILLQENAPYIDKYPIESYSVILRGKGISLFPNSYEARCKEIKKFKNIKTLIRADLQRDVQPEDEALSRDELLLKIKSNKNKEKLEIRVEVRCYKEACLLMEAWPFDAFFKGVTPSLCGIPSLPLIFNDIPKHYVIKANTTSMRKLELEFGLVDVTRVYQNDDISQPKPQIKALPTTIKSYIDAVTIGVDICSGTRIAKPDISYAKLCAKCSSLDHYKCPEDAETYCKKCCLTTHTTDRCPKPKPDWRCRNCQRNHRADSEECEVVRRITFKKNDYPISILLGENIIRHISKILRNQNIDYEELSSNDNLTDLIASALVTHPIIQDMQQRLANEESHTSFILNELNNLAEADARIMSTIQSVDAKVDNLKIELKSDIAESRNENMTAHAANSQKQDEANAMLTQLLAAFNKITQPEPLKKGKGNKRDKKEE